MSDPQALSIDRHPDPACSYRIEGEKAIIQAHNEPFESICGLGVGEPIEALFESQFPAVGDPPTLSESDRVWVHTDQMGDQRFLVRIVPPENGESGYLLFNEAGDDDAPDGFGVDSVASVISHDLRNPLDVAKARLRAGRELDSTEHFDHVEQAHDRMERIIQDVLTLARGEDVVNPEQAVDFGAITRDAWQTVETNGAQLDIEGTLPTAIADRDRISRLFENLFRNSVEHGSTGDQRDRTITVTVGPLEDGFYVEDDGTGIAADDRERIFEPGYTSDDHGTGLGLAIVARIADLHGWSVTVTASSEGGARFEFRGVEPE